MLRRQRILAPVLVTALLVLALAFPVAAAGTYYVRPGDSLFFIAQRFGTTVQALQKANGIYSDIIYPGEPLYIPACNRPVHTVQRGESLWLIANAYGTTVSALQAANGLRDTEIYAGELLVIPTGTGLRTTAAAASTAPASPEEIDLLARMIHAEAEGEPYLGKVAVGAVILNRVRDPRFPNTISEVLFAPWEFEPVMNNRFWQITPSADSYRAAQDALAGWDPTGGALFFYNPVKSTSPWIFTRTVITQIGQHLFAV
ncbi:MAG TPA: LysM peptidoglycan-binding domain-containing protein [Firmicutes bacterium]|nr:LysM peptidoglycan-binding domain-containing protein [Bacillota bacterium]